MLGCEQLSVLRWTRLLSCGFVPSSLMTILSKEGRLTGLRVRYPSHDWSQGAALRLNDVLLRVALLLTDSELTHSCPWGLWLLMK